MHVILKLKFFFLWPSFVETQKIKGKKDKFKYHAQIGKQKEKIPRDTTELFRPFHLNFEDMIGFQIKDI